MRRFLKGETLKNVTNPSAAATPPVVVEFRAQGKRRRVLVLPGLAVIAGAVMLVATSNSAAPLEVSVVSVAKFGSEKVVTMEFRRLDPGARFCPARSLRLHVAGQWESPVTPPKVGDGYFLARTNCERAVFSFPAETDACRFSLDYREGASPFCRTYFFLQNHGVSQAFPKSSELVLKYTPKQSRLRRLECEVKIPAPAQNPAAALDSDRLVRLAKLSRRTAERYH